LETSVGRAAGTALTERRFLTENRAGKLRKLVAKFARGVTSKHPTERVADYLETWLPAVDAASDTKEELKREVDQILGADSDYPEDVADLFSKRVHEHLQKYLSGQLLRR